MLLASNALPARIFEVQYADTVSDLPVPLDAASYLYNLARWLMGWYHGKPCWELALQDLEIRMTKACSMYFDEEIMLAASRRKLIAELVRRIELRLRSTPSCCVNDVTLPLQSVQPSYAWPCLRYTDRAVITRVC